jgi:hypothetical protein
MRNRKLKPGVELLVTGNTCSHGIDIDEIVVIQSVRDIRKTGHYIEHTNNRYYWEVVNEDGSEFDTSDGVWDIVLEDVLIV